MSFTCGSCKESHNTVAEARICASASKSQSSVMARPVRYASEKQVKFIQSLVERKDGHEFTNETDFSTYDVGGASILIDKLLKLQDKPKVARPAEAANPLIVAGSVWVAPSGSLFRVRQSRTSPALLASELVEWPNLALEIKATWVYLGSAVRVIKSDFKLADVETIVEYGHQAKACIYCSRSLDDERSLRVGYGAICASKFGLSWGE